MALVLVLGIDAPLEPAIWFFVGAWVVAQVLGHALLPYARLTYAEDGGELGGPGAAASSLATLLVVLGTAAATTQPPTYVLRAGLYEGPLVLDRPQTLKGAPGAVVRGGIVITSDGVTVRDLVVVGGENGIEVHDSTNVRLENVTISESKMDGIHARRSSLKVKGCSIRLTGPYTQAIDISFAFDLPMSRVERCTVVGGQEGIVSHMAHVDFRRNHVRETTLRAIAVTEMSMGPPPERCRRRAWHRHLLRRLRPLRHPPERGAGHTRELEVQRPHGARARDPLALLRAGHGRRERARGQRERHARVLRRQDPPALSSTPPRPGRRASVPA